MNEALQSLFSNIRSKFTNPFFGTLIIVWAYRNWELLYTLVNFDEDCTLIDKKIFIWNYFSAKYNFWIELLINVGLALLFMVISYGLIVITRWFVYRVENRIIPELYFKSLSKLYVTRKLYDDVIINRDKFFNEVTELKNSNTVLYNDKEQLALSLDGANQKYIIANELINQKDSDIESLKNSTERINENLIAKDVEIQNLHKETISLRSSNTYYFHRNVKTSLQLKNFDLYIGKQIDGSFHVQQSDIEIMKINKQENFFINMVSTVLKGDIDKTTNFSLINSISLENLELITFYEGNNDEVQVYTSSNVIITPKGIGYYYYLLENENDVHEI
ncbi:hypothetical protein LZZ90_08240 [Flavobacterium sp. SM15]|uniref:hypothetical protein n=1 Tax=Flavobacterium sp. SM15 TaxID=2908005 RepID=UPI001EDAD67A|nr:hypothetical protein [Flavobacterium sp. SM15]MCG2611495.1 hypothetical protein [Flavobacterium sp. SM15]